MIHTELRDAVAWFRDRSVSSVHKLVGLFALFYVLSPVDLVPDFIPLIGWLDDLGVIALVAAYYARQIRAHREHRTASEPNGPALARLR
jgi:uncharacterized membrane protein YkvA (DUF1232 family)